MERTLARWSALAAQPEGPRLVRLAALAGFDPRSAPALLTLARAEEAGGHPEVGLDERARRQIAVARARAERAIGEHLDLTGSEAIARTGALAQRAAEQARAAALEFAGQPACNPGDAVRAAGRALRLAWQRFADRSFPDEAWPRIAAALDLAVLPAASSAATGLMLALPSPLPCRLEPLGLSCTGPARAAGNLRVSLEGAGLSIAVAKGEGGAAVLGRLLSTLPASVAGCLLSSSADRRHSLARLDRVAPDLAGSALEELSVGPELRNERGAVPRLEVRGRFRQDGLAPAFAVDYSGAELRILLVAQPGAGAPRTFTATLSLSSRLPGRLYELQVIEPGGILRAAGRLDLR